MFHFRFHWNMPKDTVAVRRIPCLCQRCYDQFALPWLFEEVDTDQGKMKEYDHPLQQPRFNRVIGCTYEKVMGELNDWNFVVLDEKPLQWDQAEVNLLYQDALTGMESAVENKIQDRGFGAVMGPYHSLFAKDSIYLVQWSGEAFPLQQPTVLENCGDVPMPIGTMAVRGFYWQKVVGEGPRNWYERPQSYSDVKMFAMRDVLSGEVGAAKPSEETGEPPVINDLQWYNKENRSLCRKVGYQEWCDLFCEKHTREKMAIVDIVTADEEQEVKEIRKEAEKEKEKSDEKKRKALKLKSLCNLPKAAKKPSKPKETAAPKAAPKATKPKKKAAPKQKKNTEPKQKKKPKPKDKSKVPAIFGPPKETGRGKKRR
jgi:hypothetical protein